jgi:hypothetical protein
MLNIQTFRIAKCEVFEVLKMENKICFRLYAADKEVVKRCRPYLDEIGLTYTQCNTIKALQGEQGLEESFPCVWTITYQRWHSVA